MARINLKLPVANVVATLTAKLDAIKAETDAVKVALGNLSAEKEAWGALAKKNIVKAVKAGGGKLSHYNRSYRGQSATVVFEFTAEELGVGPRPDADDIKATCKFDNHLQRIAELENILRMLKLTSQTEVSVSTLKGIAEYL